MKSLSKIIIITLLGCFFLTATVNAQKDQPKVDRKVEKVQKATGKVREATEAIDELVKDCQENKSKIEKQVKAAKKALAEAEEAAKKAKTAAAKKGDSDMAEAAQKSLEEAQKLWDDVLEKLEGIKSADAIIAGLSGASAESDQTNQREKAKEEKARRKAIDDLIGEAEEAGYKNPCDSSLVRYLVREKIKELKKDDKLKDWLEELRSTMHDNGLISVPIPKDEYWLISSHGDYPRFGIEVFGGLSVSPNASTQASAGQLLGDIQQQVNLDPLVFKSLLERLGGEFFIGEISQPAIPQNVHSQNRQRYGLGGRWNISNRWMLEGSWSRGKCDVTADFPIIVFGDFTGEMTTTHGNLSFQITETRGRLGAAYLAGQGVFRPFVGGGIQYYKTTLSNAAGRIADLTIPLPMDSSNHNLGAYGSVGMEARPVGGLYLKASLTAALENDKVEGKRFVPGVRIGAGWGF